jgi:hypothetical protein
MVGLVAYTTRQAAPRVDRYQGTSSLIFLMNDMRWHLHTACAKQHASGQEEWP